MILRNKNFRPFFLIILLTLGCSAILLADSRTGSTEKPETTTESKPPSPKNTQSPPAKTEAPNSSIAKPEETAAPTPAKKKYLAGEDPDFAAKYGWPVKYPEPLSGSILPRKRIVAYYGNPRSKRMGVLGQYPKDEMLARLKKEVESWKEADPEHDVQPALHLIAVVAQGEPGKAKKYRMIMPDSLVEEVYGWAREAGAILFIDIQTGHDDIRELLPRFEWILKNPDVHLGIDPEFNLVASGKVPGVKIGTLDAEDINYASEYLRDIVKKYDLPSKVFVIHRFTRPMVTNTDKITLRPEVAIVINMDGWGAPFLKRDSYKDYIVKEPVQFTGFKLFYHNDTKAGHPLLTPQQILRLVPTPLYIQYQ